MKQTVPLCPAQTSGSLSHPPRSSSESICVGQLEVQSVWEWGLCQQAPGRCLSPLPPFTRWPAQWTNTNGITAPLFHCSQHTTSLYSARERGGYSASLGRGREKVTGTFYSVAISLFDDLTSFELCLIVLCSLRVGLWRDAMIIPEVMNISIYPCVYSLYSTCAGFLKLFAKKKTVCSDVKAHCVSWKTQDGDFGLRSRKRLLNLAPCWVRCTHMLFYHRDTRLHQTL